MEKNKKGMTIVETIVSLVIISLAVTVGMIAMSSSAKYLNSGARLKHQREGYAVESSANEEQEQIVITIQPESGSGTVVQVPVTKQTFDDNNFTNYAFEESSTS